jgi:GNAT superfamily N-acetyltransferase
MTKAPHVQVRQVTDTEMSFAIGAAAAEGWDPGLSDASAFRAADPEGFLVAILDGEPVGCVSAVRYGSGFGFLGLFIVVEQWRGHGIGMQLWAAAMSRLEGRVVGLDGVVAMQGAYAESGFVLAHRNIRYVGTVPYGRGAVRDGVAALGAAEDLDELCAYDEPVFGGPRRSFLAAWTTQPGAISLGARQDGHLHGYVVARPSTTGHKVGPLFADSLEVAERLLDALVAELPAGTQWTLDVPEPNAAARALAQARRMAPGFETARMYSGGMPDLPLSRIFGITSFELG